MLIEQSLTERIVGLAIEVHRNTGRGLLEFGLRAMPVLRTSAGRFAIRAAGRHSSDVQRIDSRRRLSC